MKRNLLVSLLVACICIISCTSEEASPTSREVVSQEVYTRLNEELAAYNVYFRNQNPIPQTRGFWKKLKRFLYADACGAFIGSAFGSGGALFGAIFYSAVAGPAFAEEEKELIRDNDDINLTSDEEREVHSSSTIPHYHYTPEFYSCSLLSGIPPVQDPYEPPEEEINVTCINHYVTVTSEGVGYEHNMILSKIEEDNPGIYNRSVINSGEMRQLIVNEISKKEDYSVPTTSIKELVKQTEDLVEEAQTSGNKDIYALIRNQHPQDIEIWRIINDFVSNVIEFNQDSNLTKNYLKGYLNVIDQSQLNDRLKGYLKMSLEVGANSSALWIAE